MTGWLFRCIVTAGWVSIFVCGFGLQGFPPYGLIPGFSRRGRCAERMRPIHVDLVVRGRREVKAHDAFPRFRMETRRHRTRLVPPVGALREPFVPPPQLVECVPWGGDRLTQPPLALLTSLERLDSITGLGLALSLSLWLPRLPLRDWEGILEHTC
jgi:hypothetical protein